MGLAQIDLRLLAVGYDKLTLSEKNQLISKVAGNYGVPINKVSDEVILQYHKDAKVYSLETRYKVVILGGFTASNGNFYGTSAEDQLNLVAQKLELVENPSISEVKWKVKGKGLVTHSREEWLQVYKEGYEFKYGKIMELDSIKQKIAEATTHDELVALPSE
ncbi:tail fiber protein [Bacillus phage BvP]|uniref:DUF4376 domain-containing protein n=1 Tax=Bacillus phage vB_BsuM-Goe3 TaxID=1933063 RepID=A0A217ER42_BPGO3|nr:tail fiber protein [Bacillus phage vB_BsuM-Goe3]APZ82551.1 hypothetical protein Goe3_c09000 [Bacillus phage vB_BsuM-Goe3]